MHNDLITLIIAPVIAGIVGGIITELFAYWLNKQDGD